MNKIATFAIIAFSSLLWVSAVASSGSEEVLIKEKWDQVEVKATVHKIDVKSREVTLMGAEGNLTTIIAGKEIKRLDEISVGDVVTAEYLTYLSAEFRAPTAEEEKEPLVVIAAAGKAPAEMSPGGQVGAIVKAVVSIEIINRPFMEVTIKGPRGNFFTVPVKDKKLITEINVGQRLIMVYAEAVALSLEKIK